MSQGSYLFWFQWLWLLLMSVLMGWILTDFHVPHWIWGMTLAVTVHLAWSGRDAIFLAMVWLVSVLWMGVIRFSWPESLHPEGWSNWVLLSWVLNLSVSGLMAISFVVGLASCQEDLERRGDNTRKVVFGHRQFICLMLSSTTSLSFGAGWLLHPIIKALIT